MSMEFDAVSKYLLDVGPGEWLALSGRTTSAKLTPVVSDLSTVTANADKFYLVEEHSPWLVNFEPFSSRDPNGPARVCLYSNLGLVKLGLPVYTVVVLLSRRANAREWTGTFQARIPGKTQPYLKFQYDVIRIWEIPAEVLLNGGIGTLALAPISKIGKNELPQLMRKIFARVDAEVPPGQRRNYLAAMSSLMGLCHNADFVEKLFKGIHDMRESSVVQEWLKEGRAEGRLEGERDALLTVLKTRFGRINASVNRRLSEITDIKQLQSLLQFASTDPNLEAFVDHIPKKPQ